MPLPQELDQQIHQSFDEIINEWNDLIPIIDDNNFSHASVYQKLVVKSCGLVGMLFSNSRSGDEYQESIKEMEKRFYGTESSVNRITGILIGLKENYEDGFYDDLQRRLVTEISADYMGLAEALLNEGISGQYDHVPAAVLCGAVLENRLRHWCDSQTPPIPTTKSDGSNKTLGPLTEELRKTKKFDKQVLRQLQWWTDIRNHRGTRRI